MKRQVTACGRQRSWHEALRLHAAWQQSPIDRVVRTRFNRVVPPVLVDLGELMGVIYRSTRGPARQPRCYVHWFEVPPRLSSGPDGRSLHILGGAYRVGRRGIEG